MKLQEMYRGHSGQAGGPQTPREGWAGEAKDCLGCPEAMLAWGLSSQTPPAPGGLQLPGWGRCAGLGLPLQFPRRQLACAGSVLRAPDLVWARGWAKPGPPAPHRDGP